MDGFEATYYSTWEPAECLHKAALDIYKVERIRCDEYEKYHREVGIDTLSVMTMDYCNENVHSLMSKNNIIGP